MSNFKLIFLGIFVVGAVIGLLVFSGIINVGTSSTTVAIKGTATIWGTFDSQAFSPLLEDFNLVNQDVHIAYVQKDPATFDTDLVEAIATGQAPDLVLLPDSLIWRFENKMTHVLFASLPEQTFLTTFTTGANIFSVSDGSIAIPWASDPLVMYYNRDMLESAGVAQPPKTWKDFESDVPLFAKKETDLTLTQMAAALGSYKNIEHAKDILALLFTENNGAFISSPDSSHLAVHFGSTAAGGENAGAIAATNLYMSFSDPLQPTYTWNAGLPLDRDAFIQSNLAFYFGTASELPLIRASNPNLNFGIALPPQASDTAVTTGHMYGFAIPKAATNPNLSFAAATLLAGVASESDIVSKLGTTLALMPARRDVLAQKPTDDPYLGFFFDAALVEKSWLDPNPAVTDQIFSTFISDISSSALSASDALTKASAQLGTLNATI